jgi:fatty acid desaturase
MTGQKYIPGVCNIGPAERARRRQSGLLAAAVTIALLMILMAIHTPTSWRLLIFLPATAAASGYLQSAFHFCAGFGMRGLYNVVNSAGITNDVQSEEFRRKDRSKALTIVACSALIGAAVAVASLWL